MNTNTNVCAVVVTYNRCALLQRVVAALRNQTHKIDTILIVNNSSSDDTLNWLETQDDLIVITQPNLGGSGGFNRGCKFAIENNYDYAWLMDDDGFPVETALEHLLNTPKFGLSVTNSLVVDIECVKLSFPLWYLGIRYDFVKEIKDLNIDYLIGMINPFNGTLVPIEVMKIIGPPHGDMFIWGDESEFFNRILSYNIPVVTVIKSEFHHPIAKEIVGGDWPNDITWKKYYSTRNSYRTLLLKNRKIAFMKYSKNVFMMIVNLRKTQKTHLLRKTFVLISAYFAAITNDFGKLPPQVKSIRYFLNN